MMMKTSLAVALSLALLAGSASAEFKDMTVNGQVIMKAAQEKLASSTLTMNQNPHAMMDPEFEDNVRHMLIEAKVMADVARKAGIDKLPEVQEEIATQTEMILMQRAIGEYIKKNPVKDEEVKAAYDKEKAAWGDQEVHVRLIVVKDKTEAAVLLKSIQNGENFAKLAAEKSLDESSKEVGGLLEWMSPNSFRADLKEAIKKLKKGEVVKEPVQSASGFFILKLEDSRPAEMFPTFEAYKNDLTHQLINRKVQAYVQENVKGADVKQ